MEVKTKKNPKSIILIIIVAILILLAVLFIFNKEGSIEIQAKTSLDRIIEKSDLETVDFTYNVIAKKCKDKEKCNKNSNDIDDFEYVVSCKGKIVAGIDFNKIKVDANEKDKKIIVSMPEASVTEVNVLSLSFLNGEDVPASELANARELCQDTIKEKSNADGKLILAAKEQAEVVIKSFYETWTKAIDKEFEVEFK